jgi:hypothetical protein
MYQLSFCVFMWAFHPKISFFDLSFPVFVLFVLQYFPFPCGLYLCVLFFLELELKKFKFQLKIQYS